MAADDNDGKHSMNIFPLQFANVRSNAGSASLASGRSPILSSAAVVGIAIVSLLPALFWTALIWAGSQFFGWNISAATLATLASAIAVFLGLVCSAIIAAD